jgi:prepilin-type N-terminal cleavage/methylation domain-containing protein
MYLPTKDFKKLMKQKQQNGFGVIELVIVLLIVAIIIVLALPQIMSSRRLIRFSGVQRQVVSALREARQEAMSQRATITFQYDNTNKRTIIWGGSLGNLGDSRNRVMTVVGDGLQPNDIVYGRPTGATTAALGDGTNITNLTSDKVNVAFQTDGSVIDASNNPQNQALFFYATQNPAETAFAVSVLGAGGRTKIWRYNSGANIYVE